MPIPSVMLRPFSRTALVVVIGFLACASSSSARPSCVRSGESVVASSPQLVMVRPSNRVPNTQGDTRTVCRRVSGRRVTLASLVAICVHCGQSIAWQALRGPYAYAVVSNTAEDTIQAELRILDSRTGRVSRSSLTLGDHDEREHSRVSDFIATTRGRAVLRIDDDFAATIVVAGPRGATVVDEGLRSAVGRPRIQNGRVVWRHAAARRSSPLIAGDRCSMSAEPPLATTQVLAVENRFCLRRSGRMGQLDGAIVRLVGSLAVVRRADDVRVVDLRSGATTAGPIPVSGQYNSRPTVDRSGTLVLTRPLEAAAGGTVSQTEIVAARPGIPERVLAQGDLSNPRVEDGLLRYDLCIPGGCERRTIALV